MTGQGGFGKGGWVHRLKFPQFIGIIGEFGTRGGPGLNGILNRTRRIADDWVSRNPNQPGDSNEGTALMIARALVFLTLLAVAVVAASPAMAQSCTRTGTDVTCDDGRRGVWTGDAIIWPDGTRANLASPHPSVIIGNKSSVVVGPGVFVGSGKGKVPLDNPSAPNKARCTVLDSVPYCY
jgi:hypothetical protein